MSASSAWEMGAKRAQNTCQRCAQPPLQPCQRTQPWSALICADLPYLPQVGTVQPSPAAPDPAGTWGVVFGGDTTLEYARQEITKTAERMGIGQGEVFRRAGSFRSVKVFVSRSQAEDALGKARVVRPSSYLVNMSTWCPTSEQKQGYFECGTP